MIRPPRLLAFGLWIALVRGAGGGEMPRVEPGAAGFSAAKLAALKPALEKVAADGSVAGGVVLIARHGKIAFCETFGSRDLATHAPMTEDAIFAVASMTKPITCVAAMTLVEQGKLGLDDPASKYLPELKDLRVMGEAKDDTPDALSSVPAARPVTIRDLLTHTSGVAYGGVLSIDPRLGKAYDRSGVQDKDIPTIAEKVRRIARVPLAHQPGARWTYGMGHDVMGRIIEVASGKRFDVYLDETIFGPLGLVDTGFGVPEAKRGRVATVYRTGLFGGPLVALPAYYGSTAMFSGGGGLFSTARDYARFGQMLLDGGTFEGHRILKAETLAGMTRNQIGDLNVFGIFKYGFGFGLEMTGGPGGEPAVNRYFWGGFLSTNFWVEPRRDLFVVIMTQVIPTNHGGLDGVVRRALDRSVEDEPGPAPKAARP